MSWRRDKIKNSDSKKDIPEPPTIDEEQLKNNKRKKLEDLKKAVSKAPKQYVPFEDIKVEKETIVVPNKGNKVGDSELTANIQQTVPVHKKKVEENLEEEEAEEEIKEGWIDFKNDKDAIKMGVNSLYNFQFMTFFFIDKILSSAKLHKNETLTLAFAEQRKVYENIYKEILARYGSLEVFQQTLDPIAVWAITTVTTVSTHLALDPTPESYLESKKNLDSEKIINHISTPIQKPEEVEINFTY
jgi:hypothetical protein